MPTAPVPSGPISIAVGRLVDLVAASATFQARVGASDSAGAKASIFQPFAVADSNDQVPRPCAVVSVGAFGLRRVDTVHLRPDRCSLLLILSDDSKFAAVDQSQTDFTNFAGGVVADVAALQGQDTRLAIDEIRLVTGPALTHPKYRGAQADYWIAAFEVFWSRL